MMDPEQFNRAMLAIAALFFLLVMVAAAVGA